MTTGAAMSEGAALIDLRDELVIEISRDRFARFTGWRADLVAEGLIAADFELPGGANGFKRWTASGFEFSISRLRPPGMKRGYANVDYWSMTIRLEEYDFWWGERRELERKLEELIYRRSPKGYREARLLWDAHSAAQEDEAFQRFLSLSVPPQTKPGRPRRASE